MTAQQRRKQNLSEINCDLDVKTNYLSHGHNVEFDPRSPSLHAFLDTMHHKQPLPSPSTTLPTSAGEVESAIASVELGLRSPLAFAIQSPKPTPFESAPAHSNLHSLLFDPARQSESRKSFLSSLLRQKVGGPRLEQLSALAASGSIDAVLAALTPSEQPLTSLFRCVFAGPGTPVPQS